MFTPSEFAAKIRNKYDAYHDVDDLELVNKIVGKYPEYKDQINFGKPPMSPEEKGRVDMLKQYVSAGEPEMPSYSVKGSGVVTAPGANPYVMPYAELVSKESAPEIKAVGDKQVAIEEFNKRIDKSISLEVFEKQIAKATESTLKTTYPDWEKTQRRHELMDEVQFIALYSAIGIPAARAAMGAMGIETSIGFARAGKFSAAIGNFVVEGALAAGPIRTLFSAAKGNSPVQVLKDGVKTGATMGIMHAAFNVAVPRAFHQYTIRNLDPAEKEVLAGAFEQYSMRNTSYKMQEELRAQISKIMSNSSLSKEAQTQLIEKAVLNGEKVARAEAANLKQFVNDTILRDLELRGMKPTKFYENIAKGVNYAGKKMGLKGKVLDPKVYAQIIRGGNPDFVRLEYDTKAVGKATAGKAKATVKTVPASEVYSPYSGFTRAEQEASVAQSGLASPKKLDSLPYKRIPHSAVASVSRMTPESLAKVLDVPRLTSVRVMPIPEATMTKLFSEEGFNDLRPREATILRGTELLDSFDHLGIELTEAVGPDDGIILVLDNLPKEYVEGTLRPHENEHHYFRRKSEETQTIALDRVSSAVNNAPEVSMVRGLVDDYRNIGYTSSEVAEELIADGYFDRFGYPTEQAELDRPTLPPPTQTPTQEVAVPGPEPISLPKAAKLTPEIESRVANLSEMVEEFGSFEDFYMSIQTARLDKSGYEWSDGFSSSLDTDLLMNDMAAAGFESLEQFFASHTDTLPPAKLTDPSQRFTVKSKNVIDNKMKDGSKAPSEQIRSMLKGAGIRDAELAWTGLEQLLKDNPKPTKEELMTLFENDGIGLNVIEHKSPTKTIKDGDRTLADTTDMPGDPDRVLANTALRGNMVDSIAADASNWKDTIMESVRSDTLGKWAAHIVSRGGDRVEEMLKPGNTDKLQDYVEEQVSQRPEEFAEFFANEMATESDLLKMKVIVDIKRHPDQWYETMADSVRNNPELWFTNDEIGQWQMIMGDDEIGAAEMTFEEARIQLYESTIKEVEQDPQDFAEFYVLQVGANVDWQAKLDEIHENMVEQDAAAKDPNYPKYKSAAGGGKNYREFLYQLPLDNIKPEGPISDMSLADVRAYLLEHIDLIGGGRTDVLSDNTYQALVKDLEENGYKIGSVADFYESAAYHYVAVNHSIPSEYKRELLSGVSSGRFKRNKTARGYVGGHWKESGVAFNVLTDDELVIDGKRYLQVIELQSDMLHDKEFGPKMPFKDTWYEIGLKDTLKRAVEEDYDGFAIVKAQRGIDQYNEGRSINATEIQVATLKNGSFKVLFSNEDNMQKSVPKTVKPNDLLKWFPMPVVHQILKKGALETIKLPKPMYVENGKIQLYDKAVPGFLKKFTRKVGGEFKDTETHTIVNVDEKLKESLFGKPTELWAGLGPIPNKESLEAIHRNMTQLHDWALTFGEARRTDPELYNKLMSTFYRRNAAIEKALNEVYNATEGVTLTAEQRSLMAEAYEDKTKLPPQDVLRVYDTLAALNRAIETISMETGIISKPFHERMIEENLIKIEQAKTKRNGTKLIEELLTENKRLAELRYLPHRTVVGRMIEKKLANMETKKRPEYIDKVNRMSSHFQQRRGKYTLKEYVDAGVLEPGDIDMIALTAENLIQLYRRMAMKSLYDFGKAKGIILPESKELVDEKGWYTVTDLGITSPELQGQAVHPLLATSLKEMRDMRLGTKANLIRRSLGATKIAQFINPQIIFTYDVVQKFIKGMYQFNPITETRHLAESFKHALVRDESYHRWNELGLFQFPYETPRASMESQTKMMVHKTMQEYPEWKKKLETVLNMPVSEPTARDIFFAAYNGIANVTWFGDKVLRMSSVKALMKMGYDEAEAVQVAARGHAAYSELSTKYKETMSYIAFVHSFRVLMPMELAKIAYQPVAAVLKTLKGTESVPKHKWERMAKSVLATIAIPVVLDQYLKARGFETDKAMWKWKKTVKDSNGRDVEIVASFNNIINMPAKYFHRMVSYNPIEPHNRMMQAVDNIAKWELHPVYRIFFWDIKQNRRSFGKDGFVYDPSATPIEQAGQMAGYAFGQMFRLYGKLMDAAEVGTISGKEFARQRGIINDSMSKFDKLLIGTIGYAYVRMPKQQRQASMLKRLERERSRRFSEIRYRYDDGPKRDERLSSLDEWYNHCKWWVANRMD